MHEGHEEDGAVPGDVQPEYDRTPNPGTICWVTGQGTNPGSIGEADVDNGRTTLTSVVYNLSAYSDPVIGYWRWFYTNTPNDTTDTFDVYLSNNGGGSWTLVERVSGRHNHWHESRIRVADYLPFTSQMRLRFVAADVNPGNVVEALRRSSSGRRLCRRSVSLASARAFRSGGRVSSGTPRSWTAR